MGEVVRRLRFRGPFMRLYRETPNEVLLAGPAGTGKSTAGLFYIHFMALKYPGARMLIVRKTARSLASSTLVTFTEYVANDALRAGLVHFFGGNAQEPTGYRYNNGSRVVVSGLDDSERIKSTEFDIIFVDEATELSQKDWQTLTSRLRHNRLPFQQIIGACNPAHPQHWLKMRCDAGRTVLMETRHEHNPAYYDEHGDMTPEGRAYIEKLDNLTGLEFQRLRKGIWASAEGIIYDTFDPAIHVIEPFDIPWEWPRYWSIDFGFDHPFVWQRWAEGPDGELYLYREWYKSNMVITDHAQVMLDAVTDDAGKWIEPRPQAIICDHDAQGRAQLELSLNMGTTPATKNVIEGIQAVSKRFTQKRLFILSDFQMTRDERLLNDHKPTSVVGEIGGYVWDTSNSAKAKERPVKKDDDGCDAMRYMCAQLDVRSSARVRWVA